MKSRSYYSSPCMQHETDPTYHGFLSNIEAAALILPLLHAERAGAQLCAKLHRDAPSELYRDMLKDIGADEKKSCRGLINSLHELGEAPDDHVGDFVEKCLAIEGFIEQLKFLNKGQQWVIRKIKTLLPRIQQASIHAQLKEMLDDHQHNVDSLNTLLE